MGPGQIGYKQMGPRTNESGQMPAKSTDHDKLTVNKLTTNQRFRHCDFVKVISSQSEGFGKMALGIVKYF